MDDAGLFPLVFVFPASLADAFAAGLAAGLVFAPGPLLALLLPAIAFDDFDFFMDSDFLISFVASAGFRDFFLTVFVVAITIEDFILPILLLTVGHAFVLILTKCLLCNWLFNSLLFAKNCFFLFLPWKKERGFAEPFSGLRRYTLPIWKLYMDNKLF